MDNIAADFIVPALKESRSYDRAVGFFSSTALLEVSKGIGPFVSNGGKMRLIASPHLSDEDIEAISYGYKNRNEAIRNALIDSLSNPCSEDEANRLNLLANLISSSVLDIKIAFTEKNSRIGIYHEKVGILSDRDNNIAAFSGSMNESGNAMINNYETIDVFCSWNDPEHRTALKVVGFDSIWNDRAPGILALEFPELDAEIIRKYLRGAPDYSIDKHLSTSPGRSSLSEPKNNRPSLPENLVLRRYQSDAIEAWEASSFCGIFDMATGTGKTKTGLGALVRLSQVMDNYLAAIIVCPFQHLVEQWTEEIAAFNIDPIVGYSGSSQKGWFQHLQTAIRDQRFKVSGAEFFCFVCTNGTFATRRVQDELAKIKARKLLIVDEAHNFGAEYLRSLLGESYDYRLALSATIERHGDKLGTDALFSYFGERCIFYTLEEAIYGRGDEPPRLTPYKYYPVFVTLEGDELERYLSLTREIGKCIIEKHGKKYLSEKGKMLALKRARIVSGARGKIPTLLQEITRYKDDNFILVYCGATRVVDPISSDDDIEDERQIEVVMKALGNELGMVVHQFTSKESRKERDEIKRQFANGHGYQALVAIKCLDEGVDIPSIKTAFILASTTNPREYIQRRGRLLRQAPGKDFAEIFDFVTIPREIGQIISLTSAEIIGDRRLVYNELVRAKEFASLALNATSASKVLREIEESYFGINGIEGFTNEEDFEE